MSARSLRIGTRGSRLALWQAEHVADRLRALPGRPGVEIVTIRTRGDHITDVPLSKVAGKAFFTKEIEDALLDERVDLAVHSLKDLATEMPSGLALGAVLEREDARDVLVSRSGDLDRLPPGARLGTSSLRRRALVARWRPDVELVELRGNVPTRLRRLEDGQLDAIILAAAGLHRLGFADRITAYLPTDKMLPAVAQGAIGIQVRQADAWTQRWVGRLDHAPTRAATAAERALLRQLEGGCQVPVGALAVAEGDEIELRATVCSLDGRNSVDGQRRGALIDAEQLGAALAHDLLQQGAQAILTEIRTALEEAEEP
ncbi:MAG: hydroxymethylbilane synthase [Acidobacteriota bacterium]|nr:MAG: hydroxymethylbilane synthase [Acidobacteriota bacterium]